MTLRPGAGEQLPLLELLMEHPLGDGERLALGFGVLPGELIRDARFEVEVAPRRPSRPVRLAAATAARRPRRPRSIPT